MTDAKEVGVGNPAEENTFCHRTLINFIGRNCRHNLFYVDESSKVNGHLNLAGNMEVGADCKSPLPACDDDPGEPLILTRISR